MCESVSEFTGTSAPLRAIAADMLFIPVFLDEDDLSDLSGLDEAVSGDVGRARASGEFHGKLYEFFITRVSGAGWGPERVALVGAGRRQDLDIERWRRVAAACSYTARLRSVHSSALLVRSPLDVFTAAEVAADGLSAAEFDGGTYKRRNDIEGRFPGRILIAAPGADAAALSDAVWRGR